MNPDMWFPMPQEGRHQECLQQNYDISKMPKAAVIIPYLHEDLGLKGAESEATRAGGGKERRRGQERRREEGGRGQENGQERGEQRGEQRGDERA